MQRTAELRSIGAAIMTPFRRKLLLTTHVTASVGWLGALAVFFAHALASVLSQTDQVVQAASLAMGLTAWFVIMPLSIATVVTGVVQALVTAWGLVRHYWILFKLVLTGIATAVLLLKMQPISDLADAAAQTGFTSGDLLSLRKSLTLHAAGGLLVLLAAVVLAVYKPAGLTRFGAKTESAGVPVETPGWAKIFGLVLGILLVLVAGMAVFGRHGPGAH